MNYTVKSKVNIADLQEISEKVLNNMFFNLVNREVMSGGISYSTTSSTITKIKNEDLDVLSFELKFSIPLEERIDYLRIRRIAATLINKFVQQELESVAFKVITLEIN